MKTYDLYIQIKKHFTKILNVDVADRMSPAEDRTFT